MQCPVCKSVNLVMSERRGVEIDYCPQCRGIWLDRGELDKLIDKSLEFATPSAQPTHPPAQAQSAPAPYPYAQPSQHSHAQQGHYYKKKRSGFLADIFDFD